MAITEADIQAFTNFLRREAANGGSDLTIGQIAAKSETSRKAQEVVEAVREGQAEFAAGGGRPASEVIAEIRDRLSAE